MIRYGLRKNDEHLRVFQNQKLGNSGRFLLLQLLTVVVTYDLKTKKVKLRRNLQD